MPYCVKTGRIYLGRHRKGEARGKYGMPGGFIDLHHKEKVAAAVCREVWEEMGVRIPNDHITTHNTFTAGIQYDENTSWNADHTTFNITFIYPMTDEDIVQIRDTDEMEDWKSFSLPEVEDLFATGNLRSEIELKIIRKAYKLGKIVLHHT